MNVCIAGCGRWLRKRSYTVVQWNDYACSSGSSVRFASGRKVNRWSAAGIRAVLVTGLGKPSIIYSEYSIIDICTVPDIP